jgi:hypothetical protein
MRKTIIVREENPELIKKLYKSIEIYNRWNETGLDDNFLERFLRECLIDDIECLREAVRRKEIELEKY